MSRRTRKLDRLANEQPTVGMQRAERRELQEMTNLKKVEAARVKALRTAHEKDHGEAAAIVPRRIARPGKPLKRVQS
jgi:hypothetical protein